MQRTLHLTWTTLERERTPLGELELLRWEAGAGTAHTAGLPGDPGPPQVGYEIRIDGSFLMATHGASSERAMAALAHERLDGPPRPLTVLVGGLGCGHTLRAALDLPGVTRVVVAEIGARVLDWNRRLFAPFNGAAVDDPRVTVLVGDLWDVLAAHPGGFDLLLLDVDNARESLAAAGNARLWTLAGIRRYHAALRPGGVLAVWSPNPDPDFRADIATVFPTVEDVDTRHLGKPVGEPGDHVLLGRLPWPHG